MASLDAVPTVTSVGRVDQWVTNPFASAKAAAEIANEQKQADLIAAVHESRSDGSTSSAHTTSIQTLAAGQQHATSKPSRFTSKLLSCMCVQPETSCASGCDGSEFAGPAAATSGSTPAQPRKKGVRWQLPPIGAVSSGPKQGPRVPSAFTSQSSFAFSDAEW